MIFDEDSSHQDFYESYLLGLNYLHSAFYDENSDVASIMLENLDKDDLIDALTLVAASYLEAVSQLNKTGAEESLADMKDKILEIILSSKE